MTDNKLPNSIYPLLRHGNRIISYAKIQCICDVFSTTDYGEKAKQAGQGSPYQYGYFAFIICLDNGDQVCTLFPEEKLAIKVHEIIGKEFHQFTTQAYIAAPPVMQPLPRNLIDDIQKMKAN